MKRFFKDLCRVATVLFALLLLLSVAVSCRGLTGQGRTFAYLDAPIRAEISGTADGKELVFLLETVPTGAAPASVRSLPDFTVTYSAPEALDGLCVRYCAADGQYAASLKTPEISGDFSRLCAPAIAFLTEDAVASTARCEDSVKAKTQSGITFTFGNESNLPTAFCGIVDGKALDFKVLPLGDPAD